MSEQDTRVAAEPLDIMARKIEEHAKKSDEHVIAAAMLMREARHRIEKGEAGQVKWFEWALDNIHLSKSRLYELQCIAEADDPARELERQRKRTRNRAKKHREKKSAETGRLDEERRDLIAWAKNAPIIEIRRVLELIEKEGGVALPGRIEGRLPQHQQEAA